MYPRVRSTARLAVTTLQMDNWHLNQIATHNSAFNLDEAVMLIKRACVESRFNADGARITFAREIYGTSKNQAAQPLAGDGRVNINRNNGADGNFAESNDLLVQFSDKNSFTLYGRKVSARSSAVQPPFDNILRVVCRAQRPHGCIVEFVETKRVFAPGRTDRYGCIDHDAPLLVTATEK